MALQQWTFPRNDQYPTLEMCKEIAARDAAARFGRSFTVQDMHGAADPHYPVWRVWVESDGTSEA